jgi:hypothetical protein
MKISYGNKTINIVVYYGYEGINNNQAGGKGGKWPNIIYPCEDM